MSGRSSRYVDFNAKGSGGIVITIHPSSQIHVDNTDPANPIVYTYNNKLGTVSQLVESIVPGTNVTVDSTDPKNPIVNASGGGGAGVLTENIQTASYTLLLADSTVPTVVSMNVAGANTLTIPTNATAAIPIGTLVWVFALGAGVTTITAAGGVTLQSPYSKVQIATQFAVVQLWKRAINTWSLEGDLA